MLCMTLAPCCKQGNIFTCPANGFPLAAPPLPGRLDSLTCYAASSPNAVRNLHAQQKPRPRPACVPRGCRVPCSCSSLWQHSTFCTPVCALGRLHVDQPEDDACFVSVLPVSFGGDSKVVGLSPAHEAVCCLISQL